MQSTVFAPPLLLSILFLIAFEYTVVKVQK